MKVADYVIHRLGKAFGIDKMFVVYGAANGHLIDAFTRTEDTDYVCVMHEQAGGFAAEGYAKAHLGKRFGVAIATSGPGGQNFVTPIGNCYYDSVPVLFITGQVKQRYMRRHESCRQLGFQETPIVEIVKPITKYAAMVRRPEDIKKHLDEAINAMLDGRPGPALLDIPIDVAKGEVDFDVDDGYTTEKELVWVDETPLIDKIKELDARIKKASRPVFLIGAGMNQEYASLFFELNEKWKIPCFPTWNATDVITDDYKYHGGRVGTYGGKGRNFAIQNSDLLICLGTRISGRITGGEPHTFAPRAEKWLFDIDHANYRPINQEVKIDNGIQCDLYDFLLNAYHENLISDTGGRFNLWNEQVQRWCKQYDPVLPSMKEYKYGQIHPYHFTRLLADRSTADDIIAVDCGGNVVTFNHAFESKFGQRIYTNNGNSPMGFSMAAAMGSWFAKPESNVLAIIGDGGMTMNSQELATIKNYNIGIKIIIMNNHVYGITKAFQQVNFEGRHEACGPVGYNPPDFQAVARAYGIPVLSIDNRDCPAAYLYWSWLAGKIDEIYTHEGPLLVDVNCHEYNTYEPKIVGWETPIHDMYPWLPVDQLNNEMMIDYPINYERPDFVTEAQE